MSNDAAVDASEAERSAAGEFVTVRPMTSADVPAAHLTAMESLAGVSRRLDAVPHVPPDTLERRAMGLARFHHTLTNDPDGCWVAEQDGAVVGCALAIRREALWMLSLLAIADGLQGVGVGKRLIDSALGTSAGATGGLIISSRDPRAMRRYHQAGFRLEPAFECDGTLDRSLIPAGLNVREGGLDNDADLIAGVARERRGSAHGPDIAWMVEQNAHILVAEDGPRRGFAVTRGKGIPLILGADTEGLATRLAWAALADNTDAQKPPANGTDLAKPSADGTNLAKPPADGTDLAKPPADGTGSEAGAETRTTAAMGMMTARQQWAIDVAMAARLPLKISVSVATRGDVGPFAPYLPSGVWG